MKEPTDKLMERGIEVKYATHWWPDGCWATYVLLAEAEVPYDMVSETKWTT
ncbi:hypothetical protein [Paraburkholderia sp. 32]|uniref:hypothetical protein n=1 Tax=Paraburkholderia sp. 32 TaxID=2991057 RepID=UPI003D1F1D03